MQLLEDMAEGCEVLARAKALCRVAASLDLPLIKGSGILGSGVRENLRYGGIDDGKRSEEKEKSRGFSERNKFPEGQRKRIGEKEIERDQKKDVIDSSSTAEESGPKNDEKKDRGDACLALIAKARALCADYKPRKKISSRPWRKAQRRPRKKNYSAKKREEIPLEKLNEIVAKKLPTSPKRATTEPSAAADGGEITRYAASSKTKNVSKAYLKLHRAVRLEKELAARDLEKERRDADARELKRQRAEKYRERLRQRMVREQNELREKKKGRLREQRKEEALRKATEEQRERKLKLQRARAQDRTRARLHRDQESRRQEMQAREESMRQKRERSAKAKVNSRLAMERVRLRRMREDEEARQVREEDRRREREKEERRHIAKSKDAASHLRTLRMLTQNRLRRAENRRKEKEERKQRADREKLHQYRARKRAGNMHIVRSGQGGHESGSLSPTRSLAAGESKIAQSRASECASFEVSARDSRGNAYVGRNQFTAGAIVVASDAVYDEIEEDRYIEVSPTPNEGTHVVTRLNAVDAHDSPSSTSPSSRDINKVDFSRNDVDGPLETPLALSASAADGYGRKEKKKRNRPKKWKKPVPIDLPPESYFIKNGVGRVYASREQDAKGGRLSKKTAAGGGYAALHAIRSKHRGRI